MTEAPVETPAVVTEVPPATPEINEEDIIPGLKEMADGTIFSSRAALERVLKSVYGSTVVLQRVNKDMSGISGPLKVKLGHNGESVFTGTVQELAALLDQALSASINNVKDYDKALAIYNGVGNSTGVKAGKNLWKSLKVYPQHMHAIKSFKEAVDKKKFSSASPSL